MVNIESKLVQIKELIDDEQYFTINRGRQYGKTTILMTLEEYLVDEYEIISLSFEELGSGSFTDEATFCQEFLKIIDVSLVALGDKAHWKDESIQSFLQLSHHITQKCKDKKVVLMIDEVDKASNYRVFLDFLNMLRSKFLARAKRRDFTFHSVILVGVYDIKNIKLKMISEGTHVLSSGEKQVNSPWNIAADFEVDMSFNPEEIATMLREYEKDYKTGMDIVATSEELYTYTKGYPFMVSRLCQIIHKDVNVKWGVLGVRSAVTTFLKENNELFKDMAKNLENHEGLYRLMYDVLILGMRRSFSYDNPTINMAYQYGYITFDQRYSIVVFNKIFETRVSNYFVTKNEQSKPHQRTNEMYHNIATDDYFNMELCLEKFAAFFNQDIFPTKDKELLEIQYRIAFLSYLKPLLNGIGHYHYESQLSDERRMDLIVNYGRHEYLIELKRIFSERDRTEGIKQLLGYMDGRGAEVGYYLTFDFRKKSESKVEWLEFEGKRIFEVNV